MPKVSIIIPIYNTENYLRECLDSVINQTFKDIEIICVNDGSTDNSYNILDEYASRDKRIKIINKKNSGLACARNEGLKYVSGELCHFLDSDDFIELNLYEYAINIFQNFDIDYFCFSSKSFIDGDNVIQKQQDIDNYIYTKRDGLYDLNFDIGVNTNIHVWNKIFKSSLIQKYNIRFVDKLLFEDIYFMWYYFFVSKKAYFDTEIYHHYRLRSTSIMELNISNKSFDNGIAHMYNWYELFKTISSNDNLFLQNFNNLLVLLDIYRNRTKETIPSADKYRVEVIRERYYNEIYQKKNIIEKRQRGELEY